MPANTIQEMAQNGDLSIYINITFYSCVKKRLCTHIEQFIQRSFVPQTKLI